MLFIIYSIAIFFLTIIYFYSEEKTILRNKYNMSVVYLGMLSLTLYINWATDINYTDRIRYNSRFDFIYNHSIFESINQLNYEPLFIICVKIITFFTTDAIIIYIILHIVFLIATIKGLKLIVNKEYSLLVLTIFINYPFYYGYTLNGIRQGLAFAFIILSIGYMVDKSKLKFISSSIVAILFHYGTIPFSVILIVIHFIKRLKISHLIKLYILFSILFIFNLQSIMFNFIDLNLFEEYFSEDNINNFGGGNNLRFYAFNTIFLIIFIIYINKFKAEKVYSILLKVYILYSIAYLSLGYISYSNRVASYSWFIIPLIIGYIIYFNKSNMKRLVTLLFIVIIGLAIGIPYIAFN
jgi:hypothetical protein